MWALRAPAARVTRHVALTRTATKTSPVGFTAATPAIALALQRRQLSLWPSSSKPKVEPPVEAAPVELPLQHTLPPEASTSALPEQTSAITEATLDHWTLAKQTVMEYGIGDTFFVGKVRMLFEYVHLSTGLPWYATIIFMSLFLRLSLYPLMGRSIRVTRRIGLISEPTKELVQRRQALVKAGDLEGAQKALLELTRLYQKHKVNPIHMLLFPLSMIPAAFGVFFGLRGMCEVGFAGMATQGALWFPDLTSPDPLVILPVTSALVQIVSIRLGAETGKDPKLATPQEKMMKKFLTFAMVATIPITAYMPAALLLFWNTTNFTGLILSQSFKLRSIRRLFDIPEPAYLTAAPVVEQSKPARFYDSVLASMPPLNPAANPPAPAARSQVQDPTLLRESLLSGVRDSTPRPMSSGEGQFAPGHPLEKRHQNRIDSFGQQFAEHHAATGGNPWPLPPGVSNADYIPPSGTGAGGANAMPTSASALPATDLPPRPTEDGQQQHGMGSGSSGAKLAKQGASGLSQGRAGKANPAHTAPQVKAPKGGRGYATAAYTASSIEDALLALRQPRSVTTESVGDAREEAYRAGAERIRLLRDGRKYVATLPESTTAADAEAMCRTFLQQREASSEALVDALAPRLRRIYLMRRALEGATTTLEFSSAQMAGRTVGGLGGNPEEVRAAIDLAARLAADQKAAAWESKLLKGKRQRGEVDWAPPPPWQPTLDRLERRMKRTRWADRFMRERTGRWKRILGWRVGEWDRTEANKLSHERRWYRGSWEEWQERKALKLEAKRKGVRGRRRFQAYRKER